MRSVLILWFFLFAGAPLALAQAKSQKPEKAEPPPAAAPFSPTVKFNGFIQFWNQWVQNGPLDMKVMHARLKTTALVDEKTTLVAMPEMAPTGFTLLDAYAQRSLGDGWSVMAGQFKPAFGDDRYLTPLQFKRVNYTRLISFVFPGNTNAWDMGFEVKNVTDQVTFQGAILQGAGPNKAVDNDNFKDVAGRFEWKDANVALGGSYYGGTNNGGGFTSFQNWGGLHARFNSEGFDVRLEAVLAPGDRSAFFGQVAYKTGDLEPLAWGEKGSVGSAPNYQVLGGGINYWPAPKTKLSLNVILSGVADFSAPAMGVLQAEQAF